LVLAALQITFQKYNKKAGKTISKRVEYELKARLLHYCTFDNIY
jgi:hypothetical protein